VDSVFAADSLFAIDGLFAADGLRVGHGQSIFWGTVLEVWGLFSDSPPQTHGKFAKASRTVYPVLTVKFCQPSHEFTFGVGITFVSYPLVLTPVV
jgi:hypothetical protein